MKKENFAFRKSNYVLMAASMVVVIAGFVLMSGGESTPEAYDASIFNTLRVKVAPVVAFVGFVMMIFAIMYNPKGERPDEKG